MDHQVSGIVLLIIKLKAVLGEILLIGLFFLSKQPRSSCQQCPVIVLVTLIRKCFNKVDAISLLVFIVYLFHLWLSIDKAMENGSIAKKLVESSCRLGTGSGELCLLVSLVSVDEG